MEFNIKSSSTAKDFYNNGKSFLEAATRCHAPFEDGAYQFMKDGVITVLPAPCVVNAAFAFEMFLKAILIHKKIRYQKVHYLWDLYNLLPEDLQICVSKTYPVKSTKSQFEAYLKEHNRDFIDIRYHIEQNGWNGMSPTMMLFMTQNMEKVTKAILNEVA